MFSLREAQTIQICGCSCKVSTLGVYLLGNDGCAGGGYSIRSGAAFLGSKLVGTVVGVVDLVCD